MKFEVQLNGVYGAKKHSVELEPTPSGYTIALDGQVIDANATLLAPNTVSVLMGGQSFEVHVTPSLDDRVKLQSGPHEFTAQIQDPRASGPPPGHFGSARPPADRCSHARQSDSCARECRG